jgi:hypothetical protein
MDKAGGFVDHPGLTKTRKSRENNNVKLNQKKHPMIKLTVGSKYKSTLNPTDADGRAAPISGIPVWTPADPSALQITPAADGLSALLTPLKPGTTSFSVSANADVSGDGGTDNIADSVNLLIVNEEANHLGIGITAATPEDVATLTPPPPASAAGDSAPSGTDAPPAGTDAPSGTDAPPAGTEAAAAETDAGSSGGETQN